MKSIITKWVVFLTAFLISLGVSAQNVRASGAVIDALGPIPGANTMEGGTINDAVTDVSGKYSISVSTKSTLVFSCIGYKEQKICVGVKTVLNVSMAGEPEMLDELVVVGYNVQRKSDVAIPIVSVKADEMKTFPTGNVADMLRGRAAGVNVTSSPGRPGSTPSITIHGSCSVSADNASLYIVNGSPSSVAESSTLSMDDIELAKILKDTASRAIYGTRASNGVVLVTTKRDKAGKVEASYNGYLGIQSLWRNLDFYFPEEYTQLRHEARVHGKGIIDAREILIVEALEDEAIQRVWVSGKFINWEKEIFRNTIYHNHDVSIRKGTEKIRVSAGTNYFDQQGMVVTRSGYQKFPLRLDLDFKTSEWISFGINSFYTMIKQDCEDGSFNDFTTNSLLAKIYDVDGECIKYINSEGNYNPLYHAQYYRREVSCDNYRLNFSTDVEPFRGLNYRPNASVYNQTSEDGSYKGSQYLGGGGVAAFDESRTQNWLVGNITAYKIPIHDKKYQLTLIGVQSVGHNGLKSIGYSVENLPIDKDWDSTPQGELTDKPRRQLSESNLVSFTIRAQYSLLDHYLLSMTVRRNSSNRSGKGNKWGTFPSAALVWRINQEDFLKDVSWINNLKLCVSYGIVDNQNDISNYTILGLANNKEHEFGGTFQMGYLSGKELSNPSLKWEQPATTDLGVDLSFFNDRLSGTVEYYNTHTKDLLVERSLNVSLGYTTMLDNLGRTKSSGIDLSLNGDVIRTKEFTWSLGTNLSTYKNEIIRIDNTLDKNGKPASQVAQGWIIGELANVYYDYLVDGIFQYGDLDIARDGTGNLVYTLKDTYDSNDDGMADSLIGYDGAIESSMVKVRNNNRGGEITADDKVLIRKNPKFTVSPSSTWNRKGFDLLMDWYGVSGGEMENNYLYDYNSGGSLRGKLNGVKVDYRTLFNPSNGFPCPSYSTDPVHLSAIAIQDAFYIRLRTLQLGYTFPIRLLKNTLIHKLHLYTAATNLLTFTEFRSYSPKLTPGSHPESRQYVFGVNVSF